MTNLTPNGTPVNPNHYSAPNGTQVLSLVGHRNYYVSNVIKYVYRAGFKRPDTALEDLDKALACLQDYRDLVAAGAEFPDVPKAVADA